MGTSKIRPKQLDGLETKLGMKFGWRTRLIATGEPVTDDDLRTMIKNRLLSGGERTWVTEHFVVWPEVQIKGGPIQELQELYERSPRVRAEFAAADGERLFEKWIAQTEGGLDMSVEVPEVSSEKTASREVDEPWLSGPVDILSDDERK